uniref:Uncharacterized protein n=1 Tax=Kwoniella bestiolae CBS 10118 TaxID=1296100 RepID=A0A1B9GA99_9TREE|nr:hypothetical protein I302_02792 [Kwoniella bestiolae CBS 10118]OCF27942.1 hypothetical protein I302_02792 [Kwoniella bestiolae CBS 10118]
MSSEDSEFARVAKQLSFSPDKYDVEQAYYRQGTCAATANTQSERGENTQISEADTYYQ